MVIDLETVLAVAPGLVDVHVQQIGVEPLAGSERIVGAAESAGWRAKYPNHPALEILPQAVPAPLVSAATGGRIALLLPLTGPAANQATTVRDGFQSAYDQSRSTRFYDYHAHRTSSLDHQSRA